MNDTENNWEERLKCVGCCQGDYCAGKAGEHDEELKSFLRTEIAQAEKRGEVKALESLMEDERTGGIALVMIKDRLTALRNTNE